jgi:hypothetical protein
MRLKLDRTGQILWLALLVSGGVRSARVATPHATALKCLLGGRTLVQQKVSSLLQMPRFRL